MAETAQPVPCKRCGNAAVTDGFCQSHWDEIKRIKADREAKKRAAEAEQQRQIEARKQDTRYIEIQKLKDSFQQGPPETQVCPRAIDDAIAEAFTGVTGLTPELVINALKATHDALKKVPGANANQMFFIFKEAFRRDSSAVLGGSRVKSYFLGEKKYRNANEITDKGPELAKASDLDVGYGNGSLTTPNLSSLNVAAGKMAGGLPIETFVIVPGKAFPGQPAIETPEEFFHRSGERPLNDIKRPIEKDATPSGSITYCPDGTIVENKPNVAKADLVIPASGRHPAG